MKRQGGMLLAILFLGLFGTCLSLDVAELEALSGLISAWPALTQLAVPWDPYNLNTACSDANPNIGNWTGVACLNGNIDQLFVSAFSACSLAVPRSLALAQEFIDTPLNAPIPAAIGGLTYLSKVVFSDNGLRGEIPVEFDPRDFIRHIEIIAQNPGLNGTIPSHWSFFTKLQYVDFSANQLSGSLPIGRFTDAPLLYNLGLWNNKFTGTIPSIINQLPLLQGLYLSNNLLTGTIPVELGQLTELTVLTLRKNALNLCPTANFTLASPVSRTSATCAVDQQSVTSCGCASAWSGCVMDSIPACPPQAPVAETPIATPSPATKVWASSSLIMVALFGMAVVLMA